MKGVNEQLVSGLRKGLAGIGLILVIGTVGYRLIEQWSWLDSFYMTVITVSTAGHSEVHPLSEAGRIFTTGLIFIGVGVMFYCLTRTAEFMMQRSFANVLGRRSMMKKIGQMKNHTIVCGFGRTGSRVVTELQAAGKPYVVVEESEEVAKRLDELGIPHLVGDATEEETLDAANIGDADSLVAALDSDPDNLFLTLSANGMSPGLRVIARANDPESIRKFQKAGATRVVSPVASGANQIAQLIIRPSVLDLVELVTKDRNIAMQVFEHPIDEESDMRGKTLSEAHARQALGGMVIAIKHSAGQTVFDPGPDTRLEPGDTLVAIRQTEA